MKTKIIIILAAALMIAGCDKHMTRQEQIKAYKECAASDLDSNYIYERGFDGSYGIVKIDCIPKTK